jgi:hypothetical protein
MIYRFVIGGTESKALAGRIRTSFRDCGKGGSEGTEKALASMSRQGEHAQSSSGRASRVGIQPAIISLCSSYVDDMSIKERYEI